MSQPSHDEPGRNPYEAPAPDPLVSPGHGALFPADPNSPEAIRREYLPHEVTILTIGLVFYIRAAFGAVSAVWLWLQPSRVDAVIAAAGGDPRLASFMKGTLTIGSLIGAAFFTLLAAQLRAFRNWARWTLIVFTAIAIFGEGRVVGMVFERGLFPSVYIAAVSMIVNIWIIYELLMAEDGMIFSSEYETVMSMTPGLKGRRRLRDYLLVLVTVATSAIGLLLW